MKRLSLIGFFMFLAFAASYLSGCQRKSRGLNDELRLSPEQVETYKAEAKSGNAVAAKKLWHHFEFAETNHAEGAKWKDLYDKLESGRDD